MKILEILKPTIENFGGYLRIFSRAPFDSFEHYILYPDGNLVLSYDIRTSFNRFISEHGIYGRYTIVPDVLYKEKCILFKII